MKTMPYEMKVDGMAEISEVLSKMEEKAPAVAAKALYEGAAVMSKAIFKAMDSIKTAPFKYAKNGEQRLPSPEEKEILDQVGVGIAKFDKNGAEVDTSVGLDVREYADVAWNHMSSQARTNYKAKVGKRGEQLTSHYVKLTGGGKGLGNKKPVGAVANAINSGTSFMKKQPFVRTGVRNGTGPATEAIKAIIESAFEEITK